MSLISQELLDRIDGILNQGKPDPVLKDRALRTTRWVLDILKSRDLVQPDENGWYNADAISPTPSTVLNSALVALMPDGSIYRVEFDGIRWRRCYRYPGETDIDRVIDPPVKWRYIKNDNKN